MPTEPQGSADGCLTDDWLTEAGAVCSAWPGGARQEAVGTASWSFDAPAATDTTLHPLPSQAARGDN